MGADRKLESSGEAGKLPEGLAKRDQVESLRQGGKKR